MSTILGPAHAARYPVEARQATQADAAIAAFEKARAAHPRLAAERAVLGTVAQALNVAARPTFEPGVYPGLCGDLRAPVDRDYGSYSAHPMDPRTPEPGEFEISPEDAESEATEQILSHAESVADWLAKACDTDAGRMPLDVRALEPVQIMEGAAPMLLAVLMNGDNTQALRALHRLRELAGKHFEREISERKEQLLREVA